MHHHRVRARRAAVSEHSRRAGQFIARSALELGRDTLIEHDTRRNDAGNYRATKKEKERALERELARADSRATDSWTRMWEPVAPITHASALLDGPSRFIAFRR
jgi:hypothetical protein